MMSKKVIPQWKQKEVDYLVDLMEKYESIAVINVAKTTDRQVQGIRKILRKKAIIRMSKKSLQERAFDKFEKVTGKSNINELKEKIPGQSALIFTNLDTFKLVRIFKENKWMVSAKPGQITPVNIIVPAGDTGLPTGQVISELNMTLKLPTMINNDTIHIREDTITHYVGDMVSTKEASVLKKLGVQPIESVIKIDIAWTNGELIPPEVLYLDIDELKEDIVLSYLKAQTLAVKFDILDNETVTPLTQKAHREALALLFEMPILDENILDEYIQKAEINANVINVMILGDGPIVAASNEKQDVKEDSKEPKKDDDDEPQGIGGLFG
ncbi:MAG: 50S ribosomal protein L10 [Candidatus Lokiarchaeota archaeon]|nr:50S ribosomal protein L10 [Candidatus Lokiarchaeota archaeon]